MVDIGPSSSCATIEESTLVSNLSNSKKKIDYDQWTKEELIDKIRKLELHVFQLRHVIAKRKDSQQCFYEVERKRKRKREAGGDGSEQAGSTRAADDEDMDNLSVSNGRKVKKARPFDFSLYDTRRIALKFLYLGWDYQGFACQEDTNDTIEAHLFRALVCTRLIEERAKSNYHRCGRTDKGVSAFQQVISITVRSKVDPVSGKETINYCDMLNRVLPKNIRMLAWAPVKPDFSARFSCNQRTYRYFFPRGDLDLTRMQDAAQYLIGEQDFRNLCKMDKGKTTVRRVIKADIASPPIHCLGTEDGTHPLDLCKLVIVGQSFVWHQIRCIAAVLILVGKGLEEPEIVKELLDLEKNPRKPQYSMAVDFPLVLYDVRYPDEENQGMVWEYPEPTLHLVVADLQTIWAENAVKTAMIAEMMKDVESHCKDHDASQLAQSLLMGTKRKIYQKLMDRPKCGN